MSDIRELLKKASESQKANNANPISNGSTKNRTEKNLLRNAVQYEGNASKQEQLPNYNSKARQLLISAGADPGKLEKPKWLLDIEERNAKKTAATNSVAPKKKSIENIGANAISMVPGAEQGSHKSALKRDIDIANYAPKMIANATKDYEKANLKYNMIDLHNDADRKAVIAYYGGEIKEDGSVVFPTQAGLDAYNKIFSAQIEREDEALAESMSKGNNLIKAVELTSKAVNKYPLAQKLSTESAQFQAKKFLEDGNADKAVEPMLSDPEFKKYATLPENVPWQRQNYEKEQTPTVGVYINNQKAVGNFDNFEDLTEDQKLWAQMNGIKISAAETRWTDYVTKEVTAVFNYLYQSPEYGPEYARMFANQVVPELQQRAMASHLEGAAQAEADMFNYPIIRELYQYASGAENAVSGFVQWIDPEFDGFGITNQRSSQILLEKNPEWYTKYPMMAAQTMGQMLPTILANTASGGTAAAVTTFLTSGGNAVKRGMEQGMSGWQARIYGALVGGSEALLQNLLNGVTIAGGSASGHFIGKIANKIDSALAKTAFQFGGSIVSELTEENLQNYLEPAFEMLVGHTEKYNAPKFQDFVDTTITTVLTTGFFDGLGLKSSYNVNKFEIENVKPWVSSVLETLEASDPIYQVAEKMQQMLEKGDRIDPKKFIEMLDGAGVHLDVNALNLKTTEQARVEQIQAANPDAEVITSASTQAYLDSGLDLKTAQSAGEVLDGIVSGEITADNISSNQIDKLNLLQPNMRNVVSNTLGVEIGDIDSKSAARNAFKQTLAKYEQRTATETTSGQAVSMQQEMPTTIDVQNERATQTISEPSTVAEKVNTDVEVTPKVVTPPQSAAPNTVTQAPTQTVESTMVEPTAEQSVVNAEPTAHRSMAMKDFLNEIVSFNKTTPDNSSAIAMFDAYNRAKSIDDSVLSPAEFADDYRQANPKAKGKAILSAYNTYLNDMVGTDTAVSESDGKMSFAEFKRQYLKDNKKASPDEVEYAYNRYLNGTTDLDYLTFEEQYLKDHPKATMGEIALAYQNAIEGNAEVKSDKKTDENEFGVIRNEYSNRIDKEVVDALDALGRLFNVRIQFADLEAMGKDDNGLYNVTTGRDILLDINPQKAFLTVAGHEIGHHLKQHVSETAWNNFQRYAVKIMGKDAIAEKQKISAYAEETVAREEVACDFIGEMIGDKKLLDDFCDAIKKQEVNKEAARGFINAWKWFKGKFTGTTKKGDTETPALVEKVKAAFGTDIETATEVVKALQTAYNEVTKSDALLKKKNTANDGGVKNDAKIKNNTKTSAPTTHDSDNRARPAEQGGSGLASKPVTAYDAENLGISVSLTDVDRKVKDAINVFSGIATAIDKHAPYLNSKKPITPANLSGLLIKEGILIRGGSSNSVYGEFGDHTLRISNHQAHAKNFGTSGENLSITLSGRKIGNFKGTNANKVIEASFDIGELENNSASFRKLIEDMARFVVSGEYHDTAGALDYNLSGGKDFEMSAIFRLYDDAIARGDNAMAAKLVKKAANTAGYTVEGYHGSPNKFTVFDKKKARSSGTMGRAFYFSNSSSHAGQYGETYNVFLKMEHPLKPGTITVTSKQIQDFLEAVAENEDYSIENYGTYNVKDILKQIESRDAYMVIQNISATAIGDFAEAVKLFNEVNGTQFDSIANDLEMVVFEPEQIKSANPVTYDNDGNVIPLSKRFNQDEADYRYDKKVPMEDIKTEKQKNAERREKVINNLVKTSPAAQARAAKKAAEAETLKQNKKRRSDAVRAYAEKYAALEAAKEANAEKSVLKKLSEEKNKARVNAINEYIATAPESRKTQAKRDAEAAMHMSESKPYNELSPIQESDQTKEKHYNIVKRISEKRAAQRSDLTLEEARTQYGEIGKGENPVRDVSVPVSVDGETKVSKLVRTAMESAITPNEAMPMFEEGITDGLFSYDPVKNAEQLEQAKRRFNTKHGIKNAFISFIAAADKGKLSKENVADGILLYQAYCADAAKETDTAKKEDLMQDATIVLSKLSELVREGAQITQMARMLKKLDPNMQVYALEQVVADLQRTLDAKYKKKAPQIEIPEALKNRWLEALKNHDDVEIEMCRQLLYEGIAAQVPKTWLDRVRAWRYLAMLGNGKTIERNLIGNTAFMPFKATKDKVGAIGELFIDKNKRTKYIGVLSASKQGRGLLKFAKSDFKALEVQGMVDQMGLSKYSDNSDKGRLERAIREKNSKFTMPVLKQWQQLTNWLMNNERFGDVGFMRHHYTSSFAQAAMARGYTVEQLNDGTISQEEIDHLRSYAVKQALMATYRDANIVSNFVSRIHIPGNGIPSAIANELLAGPLPFKGTPANILVRAVEYSPLSLLRTISSDIIKLKTGKITGADYIENMAKGATGAMIFGFGWLLASLGVLRTRADDDDEREGRQGYSLEIGDISITLDWLAPESIPFFMGAETQKYFAGESDADSFLEGISWSFEPMLEFSMLSGIRDMISTATGAGEINALSIAMALFVQPFFSYASQFIPTLSSQIANSLEPHRTQTYVGDIENKVYRNIVRMAAQLTEKLPFVNWRQIPYVDEFGRKDNVKENFGDYVLSFANNFFNPAYVSNINVTDVDTEIRRLKDVGESVPLSERESTIKVYEYNENGEKVSKDVVLTAEQYSRYQTTYGQQYLLMATALVASDYYVMLSDSDKAAAFEEIDKLANVYGKIAAGVGYEPEMNDSNKPLYELYTKAGIPVAEAYALRLNKKQLSDDKSLTSDQRRLSLAEMINGADNWSDEQKQAAYAYAFEPSTPTIGNAKYTDEQKLEYENIYGKYVNDVYSSAMSSAKFASADEATKVDMLYQANELAKFYAKKEWATNNRLSSESYNPKTEKNDYDQLMKSGVSFFDTYKIHQKIKEITDADGKKSIMETDFRTWISQNTNLNENQKKLAVELFGELWTMAPVNSDKYDALVNEYNFSNETANEIFKNISSIVPEEGKDTASQRQKDQAIVSMNLTNAEKYSALMAYANNDSSREAIAKAKKRGISADQYVRGKYEIAKITGEDKNKDGKTDKDSRKRNIAKYLRTANLSYEAKCYFWQLEYSSETASSWRSFY